LDGYLIVKSHKQWIRLLNPVAAKKIETHLSEKQILTFVKHEKNLHLILLA
tara:strand:- start:309 stop:461 length:153 start_codon:yes stop_codon:yes gene_type:complete